MYVHSNVSYQDASYLGTSLYRAALIRLPCQKWCLIPTSRRSITEQRSAACAFLGTEDVVEWLTDDINEPGHQFMNDNEIVAEITGCIESNDQASDKKSLLMTHLSLSLLHLRHWRFPALAGVEKQTLIICCLKISGVIRQQSLKQSHISSFSRTS